MKLKQRVLDRRSSPLVRRKDKSAYLKRRSYLASMNSFYPLLSTYAFLVLTTNQTLTSGTKLTVISY